jgi:two-component system LytT family sensor kinase
MTEHSKRHRLRNEILGVVGLYVFFALAYGWVLTYTAGGEDLSYYQSTALDYLCKGLLTLPVWWLMFRRFPHLNLWQRSLLYLAILPLWVFTWLKTYYFVNEVLGLGHLRGRAIGWDIYIPTLFYIIQFGIMELYHQTRKLVEKEKRAVELRELALSSELTALKSQLNPHFLYNVFNTINASLPPQEEYTRELIAMLADLFRYQLQASKMDRVPLQAEIEFIRSYLELEEARFQDRLTIEWDIDPALLQVPVPPMLLQPLVENAIRHGISPKVAGGTVSIQVQNMGHEISVCVIDDGIGFQVNAAENGNGVGLTNTRKILDRLYGQELKIQPNLPHGAKVCFRLPIETINELSPA